MDLIIDPFIQIIHIAIFGFFLTLLSHNYVHFFFSPSYIRKVSPKFPTNNNAVPWIYRMILNSHPHSIPENNICVTNFLFIWKDQWNY